MDSVNATKSHFGISNSEWSKMDSDEKEYLRKLSHTHLTLGMESRIERDLQDKHYKMITFGLLGGVLFGMLKK
jgi:hypothetical protein